ncbi:hypothetical protein CTAYLR_008682 [Chrysophaeum taylorii]|uniref:Glycosyl transferase family 1 domain-containing protein n=1 Tax=Chrysophaeum taylorii TaxID=2483200 RepID=A0AAD7XUG4_9STRA|nr:hypothetical protein CTAYLR_008682 [Chrysophaeum taylorii]
MLIDSLPRLKEALAGIPGALEAAEEWLVSRCAPPEPPPPPRVPFSTNLKVVLCCSTSSFLFDRDRSRLWDWTTRPTGEVVCTEALARYLSQLAATLDIFAYSREEEGEEERVETFEGLRVHCRSEVPRSQRWDVCVAASADLVEFAAGAEATHYFAMVHQHLTLPFGPRCGWTSERARRAHATRLHRFTLLCCSAFLHRYVVSSSSSSSSRVCYAADYGFFGGENHLGRFAPWKMSKVAIISPCEAKGLRVFLALARLMPSVSFLAVKTKWTTDARPLLAEPNVRLVPATPRIDQIYAQIRVLLVPSLWPEPFGLVSLEALLRGIPVVSTTSGGLEESNLIPQYRVSLPLVHDIERNTTFVADPDAYEAARDWPEARDQDYQDAAKAFELVLAPLLAAPESRFKQISAQAKAAARAHVNARAHSLAHLLQPLTSVPS